MTKQEQETPDPVTTPMMPTGSGVTDLEMIRELDAVTDADAAGDDVLETDRLKE